MRFDDWIFVIFNGKIESRNNNTEIEYLNIDDSEYKMYTDSKSKIMYFHIDDVPRSEFNKICEICKPKNTINHITKSGLSPSPQKRGKKRKFKTKHNNPMTKGIRIPGMRSDIRLRG